MTTIDSLTERVAEAIYDEFSDLTWATCLIAAEAAINELKLHPEKGRLRVTRYVSDWMPDLEPAGGSSA